MSQPFPRLVSANETDLPESAVVSRTNVLVVDDLVLDRLMVRRILDKDGGWNLTFAGNGVEGLEALEQGLPHIVLTDLQMPQMDGLALVEQIREKYPEVPVVLMTRAGSEEIAVQALRGGAASYVPKRNLSTDLVPTLLRVQAASRIDRQRNQVLACLSQRESRFRVESDPALVAPLVAPCCRRRCWRWVSVTPAVPRGPVSRSRTPFSTPCITETSNCLSASSLKATTPSVSWSRRGAGRIRIEIAGCGSSPRSCTERRPL